MCPARHRSEVTFPLWQPPARIYSWRALSLRAHLRSPLAMSNQKGELHRAQADASSLTAMWNREVRSLDVHSIPRTRVTLQVQMLLDELRAKCLAALTSPAKGKPRVDEFNDAISRAQEVYDTSENAVRARLQSQQDKINEFLSAVEAAESVLNPLRNALSDAVEIATAKRDATLALARSRELLAMRADPQPLGSWSYTYDDEGGRLFGPVSGAQAQVRSRASHTHTHTHTTRLKVCRPGRRHSARLRTPRLRCNSNRLRRSRTVTRLSRHTPSRNPTIRRRSSHTAVAMRLTDRVNEYVELCDATNDGTHGSGE